MPQLTDQRGAQSHSHSHSHNHSNQIEQNQDITHGEMNWKKFFSANFGILIGFTVMFLLAFFEDKIKVG